jgi:hypothetical protein
VRHATAETLEALEPLLEELRGLDGLLEKRRGTFYRRSQAFLHFHEDPAGPFADVKLEGDWQRLRVATARERQALLRTVRTSLRGRA